MTFKTAGGVTDIQEEMTLFKGTLCEIWKKPPPLYFRHRHRLNVINEAKTGIRPHNISYPVGSFDKAACSSSLFLRESICRKSNINDVCHTFN